MDKSFNLHIQLLINEARKRGIDVEMVFPGKVLKYQYKNHVEFSYAQYFSALSAVSNRYCANKAIAKVFLKNNNVSIADGLFLKNVDLEHGLNFAKENNWEIVLKPDQGEKGKFVFTALNNEKEFTESWQKIFNHYDLALVEKKFRGEEYRIFATQEKVLAIGNRRPANVVGNGKNTIGELIEIKNSDPRRSSDSSDPIVKIKVDDQVIQKLNRENLTLDTIPKNGQLIYLRDNSNLSTGGESIDYTDIAHPSVKEIAVKAINSIPGLLYGGVDFMTADITKPQTDNSYIIVEMNSSPGINMHHFPYDGKPRDVAGGVLDVVFPETKKNG